MAKEITSDAPKSHPKLGKWMTRCGPKSKTSTFGSVVLYGFMLSGLGSLISGIIVTPKPGSEPAKPIFIGLGVFVIVLGLLSLLVMKLWRNPQVDLYLKGIRFKAKGREQYIPWAEMGRVEVTAVYDSRFSQYRTVVISRSGEEDIEFDSRVEGQPGKLIDSLIQMAPNVARKTIDFGE